MSKRFKANCWSLTLVAVLGLCSSRYSLRYYRFALVEGLGISIRLGTRIPVIAAGWLLRRGGGGSVIVLV